MRGHSSATITHFSHPHPLCLTNPKPSHICSACKQTLATEPLYTCKSPSCATFSLHLKCSQLPRTITHPCHRHRHRHDHQNHPLSLLTRSQNPNGVFTCRACAKHGDGFLYNCKDCGINIHVACAKLPLWVSHRSHCHQLGLVFTSPYGNNVFSCDVCGVVDGSKCWLYRCGSCGFDAHLSCVTSKVQVVSGTGAGTSSNNNNFETLFMNQVNNKRDQILQGLMARGGGGGNMNNQSGRRTTTDQFEKWFVDQVNIKRDQILQGIMAGGGGGGTGNMNNNHLLQPVMVGAGAGVGAGNMNDQLLQAANMNNQLLQNMMGGGGVSMYNQALQAMMGGGGNMYNQALQAMMGGGGDGSSQLLQAMMGGGGGGGDLDISSILGIFGGLMGAGFGGFGF